MAVMPKVAEEPWHWMKDFADSENALAKQFIAQTAALDKQQGVFNNEDYRANRNKAWRDQATEDARAAAGGDTSGGNTEATGTPAEKQDAAYDPGDIKSKDMLKRGQAIIARMMDKGVPHHVAAGIVGNLVQESRLNPRAVGDSGASIGMFQAHRNGEQPAFRAWAAKNKRDVMDGNAQVDFLLDRLPTAYKGVWDRMLASKNEKEAALLFSRGYERPSAQHANNEGRMKYATQFRTMAPSRGSSQTASVEPSRREQLQNPGGDGNSGSSPRSVASGPPQKPASAEPDANANANRGTPEERQASGYAKKLKRYGGGVLPTYLPGDEFNIPYGRDERTATGMTPEEIQRVTGANTLGDLIPRAPVQSTSAMPVQPPPQPQQPQNLPGPERLAPSFGNQYNDPSKPVRQVRPGGIASGPNSFNRAAVPQESVSAMPVPGAAFGAPAEKKSRYIRDEETGDWVKIQ